MGRVVILTEKHDVCKKVSAALGLTVKHKGYFENPDKSMVCTHFVGHLLEVLKPDEINPDYKRWELGVLPFDIDTSKQLRVKSEVKEQFNIIKALIEDKATTKVVSLPDIDIEGITLQFELLDYIGVNKPVQVAWTNDMTDKSILKAMNYLLDCNEVALKYERGKARSYLDYHLGINYSRSATLTFGNNNLIRFGRCITPLLNLLVQREIEIENFKPAPYFEINSIYKDGFTGYLVGDDKNVIRYNSKGEAEALVGNLGNVGVVKSCVCEKKQTAAPKLFSLQTLQSHLGKKYGFSPDRTLELCQALYEKALTTYPRSDSEYIAKSQWNESQDYLNTISYIPQFGSTVKSINFDVNKPDKKYVNDGKVTAHSAITPTSNPRLAAEYAMLSIDEKKVFDEICKRFLATFLPAYQYESTEIVVDVNGKTFISRGNVPVSLGWKSLYKDANDEDAAEQKLPALKEGDRIEIIEFKILDKATQAPTRYGSGNIIDLMKKYKIGTSATQASFIPKLVQSKYVEVKKGKYYATDLGKQYIKSLECVPELCNPNLATSFEERLEQIEKGELRPDKFKADIISEQRTMIEKFKGMEKMEAKSNRAGKDSIGKCPICGKPVYENPKSYGCSGWKEGCKFTIWKMICGKEISAKVATELINKHETSKPVKGFKKKDGSGTFDAYLVMGDDGKVGFRFKEK